MRTIALSCLFSFAATAAQADIATRFVEGAPKDRFTIANDGDCPLGPMTLTIDLTGSAGRLIFDTTGSGAGVEVYQPFELVTGADVVIHAPEIRDGDRVVAMEISGLAPGQTVAFTIDVDDTIGQREITVSGSEIEGATLSMTAQGETIERPFSQDAIASLPAPGCVS